MQRRRRRVSIFLLTLFVLAALAMVAVPGGAHGSLDASDSDPGLAQLHLLGAMTFAASSAGVVLIRLWRAQVRREAARAQLLGLVHPGLRRTSRGSFGRVT